MKHLALLLFLALPLAAQFPPSSGKPLKIEINDVSAGVARTLSLIPGTGVSMSGSCAGGKCTITLNSTVVGAGGGDVVGTTSAANPTGSCTAGKAVHVNTATSRMFVCGPANNQWIAVDTGVAASLAAQYIDWNAASGGASIANKPTLGTAAAATLGTGAGQVPITGDYQPSDSDLTAIAALSCTENQIIKRNGSGAWVCAADATGAGGSGDVVGPASSVDGEMPLFDGITGKLLKRLAVTGLLRATSGVPSAVTPTDDAALIGNGTDFALKVLPSCSDSVNSKLLYNSTTNEFSCGTDQGAGAGGGGSSIEISNNANTLVGVASRLQLANGTGIAWSFVDEGSGRIRSTPTLDPGSVMLTTGQQTRSPGLTAEQLSSGTSYTSKRRANAATTGTTVNRLARIDSAGNAVLSASTDTGIPLWIVMSGAGTTGSAELLTEGRGLLQMVGACTRGQFVVQSGTAGQGLCTATPSDGAFVLAMADDTGGGAGLYAVVALSPFRWGGAGGATVVRQLGANFINSPVAGQVQYFRVPQACTITGWQIIADGGTAPTATFDVWMIAAGTALPTVANTITAAAKPALATGRAVDSSTLTGWTTAAANRAIGAVRIDALSGSPTSIQLSVYCQ